jgi:general secretion pathway protein A
MYNAHYQFRESPFGVTPDPQFYYSNAVYREAWAALRYGIEGRKGFIVISGEAGTGKTTLLRKALHDFPPSIKAAYIPNSLVTFTELLRLILKDLGLPPAGDDKFSLLEQLDQYLLEQFNSGRIVAVLVDEAQDLSLDCLEELRLLGNLETDKHKLLQLVLCGQPGLERKLNQPQLVQLKQRIVLRCRLRPVDAGEVGPYIEARLQAVGRRSADLFDAEAIDRIAVHSRGFPRLINIICDNALLTAYAASKFKVSAAMIEEVAGDLRIAEARLEPWERTFTVPAEEKQPFEAAAATAARSTIAEGIASSDDVPEIDGEAPSRGSRYLTSMIETWAALVLLTVLGGFLYSHSGALNWSEKSTASGRDGGDRLTEARFASGDPPEASARGDSYRSTATAASLRSPTERPKLPEPDRLTSASRKTLGPAPRDPSTGNGSSGNFFIAGTSFVRSKPTSSAEIIATLEPGTRVNVAGRTGPYYRIRSIGSEAIRGYIHQEDAFFERR